MEEAKRKFFGSMCDKSVDWPREFWRTYEKDGVDSSFSMTNLINDNLQGRMRVGAFEKEHLEYRDIEARQSSKDFQNELRKMIVETSFIRKEFLPVEEVRCGDVYKDNGIYWLNLRPDCDCIPRNDDKIDDVEVYCVKGQLLSRDEEKKKFSSRNGNFNTYVAQCVVFGIDNEESVLFNFTHLHVFKFSDVRVNRIGRLLHPYLTKVQQQYAAYSQRQALPRIPNEAVDPPTDRKDRNAPD